MDSKLLEHYRPTPRRPVFIALTPVPQSAPRSVLPTLAFGLLAFLASAFAFYLVFSH